MKACVIITAASAWGLMAAGPPVSPRPPATDEQIERLIEQLGSDLQREREESSRRLAGMDEALPAVRRAQTSGDPEIARRARDIADRLGKGRLAAERKRINEDCAAGRADILAERIALWEGADSDPDVWQAVLDLSWRLVKQHGKLTVEKSVSRRPYDTLPPLQFTTFVAQRRAAGLPPGRPKLLLPKDAWKGIPDGAGFTALVRAEEIDAEADLGGSLTVSSGSTRFKSRLGDCFALVGGDLELVGGGNLAVFICAGEVLISDSKQPFLASSVIVARGSVHCPSSTRNCVILAGGDVTFPDYGRVRDCVIRAGGRIHVPPKTFVTGSTLESGAKDHFGPVKFFDPAALGVAVAPAKFAVRVATLADAKPFAKAGLKAGDLITELDGSPATTPDIFRRLLRRRVIEGGAAVLRVRRGETWLKLRVPIG